MNSNGENKGTQFIFSMKMTPVKSSNAKHVAAFSHKSASQDLPEIKFDAPRNSKLDSIDIEDTELLK